MRHLRLGRASGRKPDALFVGHDILCLGFELRRTFGKPRMRAGKSTYKFRSRGTPICETGCAPCQPRIRWDFAIPNHDPSIREKEFLAAGPFFQHAPPWAPGFLRRPPAVDWN